MVRGQGDPLLDYYALLLASLSRGGTNYQAQAIASFLFFSFFSFFFFLYVRTRELVIFTSLGVVSID
jgi:hypothetical protein